MTDAKREYRCEECGAIFDNGLDWEKHNRKVQSRYTCETCHDTFSAAEEFELTTSRSTLNCKNFRVDLPCTFNPFVNQYSLGAMVLRLY
jgi:DNA-directed RNA polymerase subunit RPC12/RpoP